MILISNFEVGLTSKGKEAYISFIKVLTKFLSIAKNPSYEIIVANISMEEK